MVFFPHDELNASLTLLSWPFIENNSFFPSSSSSITCNYDRKSVYPPVFRKITKSEGIRKPPKQWSISEDIALRKAVSLHKQKSWKEIAAAVPGRKITQCIQRWTKVLKPGLLKGAWKKEEDEMLMNLVSESNGKISWVETSSCIHGRTSKQCRERWFNHLSPYINKSPFTEVEDEIVVNLQKQYGNKWSMIASHLCGRTADQVKTRFRSLQRQAAREQKKQNGNNNTNRELSISDLPIPNDAVNQKKNGKIKMSRLRDPKKRRPIYPAPTLNNLIVPQCYDNDNPVRFPFPQLPSCLVKSSGSNSQIQGQTEIQNQLEDENYDKVMASIVSI